MPRTCDLVTASANANGINKDVKVDKVDSLPSVKRLSAVNHPPYSQMVAEAMNALQQRKGVSRLAIRSWIIANHKINDVKPVVRNIRLTLAKAVESGVVTQVKQSFHINKAVIKAKLLADKKLKKNALANAKAAKKKLAAGKKKPSVAKKSKSKSGANKSKSKTVKAKAQRSKSAKVKKASAKADRAKSTKRVSLKKSKVTK